MSAEIPKLVGYWRSRKELTKPYNPASMLKTVGGKVQVDKDFWRDDSYDRYPWPGDFVGEWDLDERALVVKYLKVGYPCNHYRGMSGCRLCAQMLGSSERTDGTWLWPDQLDHYVEEHSVLLPPAMLADLWARSFHYQTKEEVARRLGQKPEGHWHMGHDETFWLEWKGGLQ